MNSAPALTTSTYDSITRVMIQNPFARNAPPVRRTGLTALFLGLVPILIWLCSLPLTALGVYASVLDLPASLPRIAHAGGAIGSDRRTNSLQALNANAGYFTLFEIDFNFTADGHLVCMHDWHASAVTSFGKALDAAPTLQDFETLVANNNRFTNCTFTSLAAWLQRHPDKRIVTDVKGDNLATLRFVAMHYPGFAQQFIPQIYRPEEYAPVRALGYRNIILTVYRWPADAEAVLQTARTHSLYAVTMPIHRVPDLAPKLKAAGIATYAHTVNDIQQYQDLRRLGISEIYTDVLKPESIPTPVNAPSAAPRFHADSKPTS